MSTFHVWSFLAGAAVGSMLWPLVWLISWSVLARSSGDEWSLPPVAGALHTTEPLEEASNLNILLDEPPIYTWPRHNIDTPWSRPSFRQVLLVLGSQKDSYTVMLGLRTPTEESCDRLSGRTDE